NIFSPSNGRPIVTPSQDIVLGIAYMCRHRRGAKGEWKAEWTGPDGRILNPGKVYATPDAVIMAYESGAVDLHAAIKVVADGEIVDTTVGRVIFADALPTEITIRDINREHDQNSIGDVI